MLNKLLLSSLPSIGADFIYPLQPLGPMVGVGPRRGARDAGENRSRALHRLLCRAGAKLQRYPSAPKVCSTRVRPKLQRYPLFRASSRGESTSTTISLGALIVVSEDPEVLLLHPLEVVLEKNQPPPTNPQK